MDRGALADLIRDTMSAEYRDLAVGAARIHLVDLGHVLLGPFSESSHDYAGKPRKPFHDHDKGIMAMIGRGAAVAEAGPHRHELHGHIAHTAWLGVHACS